LVTEKGNLNLVTELKSETELDGELTKKLTNQMEIEVLIYWDLIG
jgi:hypothetical protein